MKALLRKIWDKKVSPHSQLRDSPVAAGLMIGTPEEVTRKLADFRAAYACTHFIMATQLPGMDPVVATRSLELFAKEVMPRFPT